jgi:hypothetical protein
MERNLAFQLHAVCELEEDMKKMVIAALALLVAGTAPSFSQTPRSEHRDYRQQQRINQGVASGRLTPREAYRLQRQQGRIDRAQRRATRDGYVSIGEQRRIQRMQNRASRNIYNKKHNARGW